MLSIRQRLTLWYMLVLVVILSSFAAVIFVGGRYRLQVTTDQDLTQAARQLAQALSQNEDPVTVDTSYRLLTPDGKVVSSSGTAIARVPESPAVIAAAAHGQTRRETLALDPVRPALLNRPRTALRSVRVLTVPLGQPPAFILQVARFNDDVQRLDGLLVTTLLLALALGLPLAALGGWWLAGRALAPISAMTREAGRLTARAIEATDQAGRLPVSTPNDELGRLAASFNQLLDRLQAAFGRERRFTADVSHDLRTPLALAKSTIGVALNRPRSADDLRQALIDVDHQVDRLAGLLDATLLLARADADKLEHEYVSVNLSELLSDLFDTSVPVSATPSPVVYSIEPNSALQGTLVNDAVISGDYFTPGCTARLEKLGYPPIPGSGFIYFDPQHITADFDLTSGPIGKWDVVVENPDAQFGTLPEGFEVLPLSGCNDTIHTNFLGTGDFGGGTNMPARDAAFVHDTGCDCDGQLMGYIDGFAGTVCQTYIVDTIVPGTGHGLLGNNWGNPHIASWPTPNSIDISEELGQFFISWSDKPALVEVWECGEGKGKLEGETDASSDGTVYCLDTDGHGGFYDAYFPHEGFAAGIKHFSPGGPLPGELVLDVTVTMPEAWGTPQELICIPDKVLLVLAASERGKIGVYDLSTDPPTLIKTITDIFSADLDFGTYPDKPCDMVADWSDPALAPCRIIVYGNLTGGGSELVKIDSDLNILAGPTKLAGQYQSIDINPKTLNVTLWPERKGSPGAYALVEVPAGW